jgi:non-heme chloroperoxidase
VADALGDPSARPVLFLHGGGQTRHAWGGTAEAVAARGFFSLSLDQRGHGESDWVSDGDYSLLAFVADLKAVVASLPKRPALVGASLGGLAALLAEGEETAPLSRAIVLVDCAHRLEKDGATRIFEFMTAQPEGFVSLEQAQDAIARYLPNRPRPSDLSGLAKNLRLHADGRYRWHWDPQFIAGARTPSAALAVGRLTDAAKGIKVPTLIVRGRMSDVLSEEAAREFLTLCPHAEFADVSGAGHMVAGDRNDAFTAAVANFLAKSE